MDYKKAVVDRIEESKAVCELENRETINIDVDFFDYPVKPGDHVNIYQRHAGKDTTYHAKEIDLDIYFKN